MQQINNNQVWGFFFPHCPVSHILFELYIYMHNTGSSEVHVSLAAKMARFEDLIIVRGLNEPRPEFIAPPYPCCHVSGKWVLRIVHFCTSISYSCCLAVHYPLSHIQYTYRQINVDICKHDCMTSIKKSFQ